MLKCVKITSSFFVLLFELLPDTTSTVSGDCDFLRSCVNYKYIEKKKKKSYLLRAKSYPINRRLAITNKIINVVKCVNILQKTILLLAMS